MSPEVAVPAEDGHRGLHNRRNLAGSDERSTTIIVGKDRTADGSVLISHNEDDGGNVVLHYNIYPSQPGGSYALFDGGSVGLPNPTIKYMGPSVWDKAFIPGDYFGGVNEARALIRAMAAQATRRSRQDDRRSGRTQSAFPADRDVPGF